MKFSKAFVQAVSAAVMGIALLFIQSGTLSVLGKVASNGVIPNEIVSNATGFGIPGLIVAAILAGIGFVYSRQGGMGMASKILTVLGSIALGISGIATLLNSSMDWQVIGVGLAAVLIAVGLVWKIVKGKR